MRLSEQRTELTQVISCVSILFTKPAYAGINYNFRHNDKQNKLTDYITMYLCSVCLSFVIISEIRGFFTKLRTEFIEKHAYAGINNHEAGINSPSL